MNTVEQVEEILKENLLKRTRSNTNPERTLLKQFKQIDVNHDQTISFKEFNKAIESYVVGTPLPLLKELFDKWDLDKSGSLDVSEFVQGLFKDPSERKKAQEHKEQKTVERQSTSVLSEDIIEQAKRSRAARKKEQNKFRTTMSQRVEEDSREANENANVRNRLSQRTAVPNKPTEILQQELRQRVFNGPFRAGAGLPDPAPTTIRYKVSNTFVAVHPPSNWDTQRQLRQSAELPRDTVELDFVFGINSKCGMHTRKNGEIVYATAGVGVVYDPRSHKQRFFLGHDDDITGVSVDASGKFAATGCMGKSPCVIVWDMDSMEQIWKSPTGFYEREISALAFSSKQPELLVAIGADNHHMLGLWNWKTGKLLGQAPVQNGNPPQIYRVVFDEESPERFATCGFKHLKFWTFDKTGTKLTGKNATYGKVSNAPRDTMSVVFLPNNSAVSGGSNGILYLWDTGKNICTRAVPAHDGAVLAILLAANNQLITSGEKDKSLSYWNSEINESGITGLSKLDQVVLPKDSGPCLAMDFLTRGKATPLLVVSTKKRSLLVFSPESSDQWKTLIGGHFGNLYGVARHPTHPSAFCSVGEDKMLNIWDAESKQLIEMIELPEKAQCVSISNRGRTTQPGKEFIAVGMNNGMFYVVECGTYTPIASAKHTDKVISVVTFSPDGSYLAVGSHEGVIDIYDANNNFEHRGRLKGHTSAITHIDWSMDSTILQSTSQAYELLFWDVLRLRQIKDRSLTPNIDWETYSCTLGFNVMAIWNDGSDGTDINAVARSNDLRLLATGDDFGNVNIFNYPVLVEDAPCHTLKGHSSHVMNVAWLADSRTLVTVGGHDRTVMQWKRVSVASVNQAMASTTIPPQQDQYIRASNPWKPKTSWK